MLTQDLQIINDVRLLSIDARNIYEALAKRMTDQHARNVLKSLARHRMEIVAAISIEEDLKERREHLSEFVPESIRGEKSKKNIDIGETAETIPILIAKERREIVYLRNEVKRIKNYTLRCRLSSFVATLQMDFDQLQSLASVPKTVTKGDGNE